MEVKQQKPRKLLSSAAQLMQSSLAAWKKTINNQWLEGDLTSQFSAITINTVLTADRLLQICDVSSQWLLFLHKYLKQITYEHPGLLQITLISGTGKKKFLLVEFAFLSITRYFKKERNKQTLPEVNKLFTHCKFALCCFQIIITHFQFDKIQLQ